MPGDLECGFCHINFPRRPETIYQEEYCEDCRRSTTYCDYCSVLGHVDNEQWCEPCDTYMCGDCIESHDCSGGDDDDDGPIHDHSYTPNLRFYGEGPLYMGVEIEVDGGNNPQPLVNSVERDSAGDESDYWLKEDGSLSSRGIEVVTHPASLAFHKEKFPWKRMINAAKEGDFKSHNTDTCGMHVHVSRAGLGASREEQETTISNLIILFYNHWDDLVTFSRRDYRGVQRWAKGNHAYKQSSGPRITSNDVKRCKDHGDRYVAINTCNNETVEFRMFRGTLNRKTILATLEMLDCLVKLCKYTPAYQIYRLTWKDIVKAASKYDYLPAYLVDRGIGKEIMRPKMPGGLPRNRRGEVEFTRPAPEQPRSTWEEFAYPVSAQPRELIPMPDIPIT